MTVLKTIPQSAVDEDSANVRAFRLFRDLVCAELPKQLKNRIDTHKPTLFFLSGGGSGVDA